MATCPGGHASRNAQWCEVCGRPIPGAAAPAPLPPTEPLPVLDPAPSGAPTAAVERCPRCGTPREERAAFCEECSHHFPGAGAAGAGTTDPAGATAPPPPFPSGTFPGGGFPPPYERTTSRPSQTNRTAEPLPEDATITGESLARAAAATADTTGQAGQTDQAGQAGQADDDGDFLLPPPTGGRRPAAPAAEPPGPGTWTAVVAPDRAYFTAMMARSGPESEGLYFPSYSPELRVALTGPQVAIGRRRNSTGEAPEIDLSRPPEDPGVSHRHAVLVRRPDGGWAVVDQSSTNGTTVNGAADPIAPYQPVDLADGDRVHVGAWTTITLHRD
ncbi:FHA domain-containing protein [Streptomyces sp. PTM05]|uniref:FHA domain-containing protein n=1 Tax=Streptantibioticus parmotrematis TaxID=2873249 RepID=A0ABS7QTJ5_9ACTN|nr:FHA domain-containing protein [Streptantibioticus parmotrematis]MBY8886511.1 FHA domain-containing protein [Streptantibioticus parmotrematis]